MSHGFDPYHKWLGIPADESPPNHYRLLGISLFESDLEVIENALKQRTAHLKSLAVGDHATLSQRLVNEMVHAGVCLLQPAQKQAYDIALQATLAAVERGVQTQSVAPPPPPCESVVQGMPHPDGPQFSSAPAPLSAPEFGLPFDPYDDTPGVVARPREMGRDKPTSSAICTGRRIVGTVISGALGLAVAYALLCLLLPHHPWLEPGAKETSSPPPGKSSKYPHLGSPSDRGPATTPPESETPKPDAHHPNGRPMEGDNQSDDRLPPNQSRLPPDKIEDEDSGELPKDHVTRPNGDPPLPKRQGMEIVLDMTRRLTGVPIPKAPKGVNGKATVVSVKVEDVTGLGTPYEYEMKPDHGRLRPGQPVSILFKDYPNLGIDVSLGKDGTSVEVTPWVVVGQNKKLPKKGIQLAGVPLIRNRNDIANGLANAAAAARAIQAWLNTPGAKPAAVAAEKRRQLNAINAAIPGLQQSLKDVQSSVDALQRLSDFVKKIHNAAAIHLIVGDEAEHVEKENN
jgi:hypothetical protein